MSKRIQCFGIVCIVVSMALCPFLSVSASLYGTAYSKPYMPVCPSFPTAESLPFGADTIVICATWKVQGIPKYRWYFLDRQESVVNTGGLTASNAWSFMFLKSSNNPTYMGNFYFDSYSQIIRAQYDSTGENIVLTNHGSIDNTYAFFHFEDLLNYTNTDFQVICSESYHYRGFPVDVPISNGTFSESDFVPNVLRIADYPTSVSQAVDSIESDTSMIQQYYTSLNSRINSLAGDVAYLQGYVESMNDTIIWYGDEIISVQHNQSSEYQSALYQAQSEIESNAHSAAQSAADEVNNAGEDVSDIDTDMDDVNSIVQTLDGWIERLDTFADSLSTYMTGVAGALDNASALVTGFLDGCPAVVIALFGFSVVFLVVRKIIGR